MAIGLATKNINETDIIDTPEYFEDTNFIAGDSPASLDFNSALGRNSVNGFIINDGPGDFQIRFSVDGAAFGDAITIKNNEVFKWEDISVDTLQVIHVSNSAYRASGI